MAIFEFQQPNTHFTLENGRGFTNGMAKVLRDVPEGEIADLLRRAGRTNGVQELSKVPHETLCRYADASNENAHYPMPDFANQRVVLVGRGVSSIGYRERYGAGYVVCGINPASIPSRGGKKRDEPTDGVHAGDYSFDCIFSLDQWYYHMEYVKHYKGPVLGPDVHGNHYFGAGTFHGVTKILPRDASLSFGLALDTVVALGASDVILCGCDFSGPDYSSLRAVGLETVLAAAETTRIWIDKDNQWKPEGIEVWNG